MIINIFMTMLLVLSIIIYGVNKNFFLINLSVIWSFASVLIIYAAIKYSLVTKFMQLRFKKIIEAIKSHSKNNISPLSSLSISLAAKIGVGSLSGVAIAIYYGGIGTIFWLCLISLIVAINAYVECILGIKYREKINNSFWGGPSYYIKKCLNNNYLSKLYSIIIIITYSFLFLSIQVNTIVVTGSHFMINKYVITIILVIITLLIIIRGFKGISKVNTQLVPIMLALYFGIGVYIFICNFNVIPQIIVNVFREAFNYKTFLSVFLIGMERAIFITESSIGTSAISASTCDNEGSKQGLLEVFGIYVTIFVVCLTTFLIIATSNYQNLSFRHVNGIELILYALKYHLGYMGEILLAIITILFAFSTIISSYFFGESNLMIFSKRRMINHIFKIIFIIIIIMASFIKANYLWNMVDFLVAMLAIINVYAILKIDHLE